VDLPHPTSVYGGSVDSIVAHKLESGLFAEWVTR
jgi:hypothetical protein